MIVPEVSGASRSPHARKAPGLVVAERNLGDDAQGGAGVFHAEEFSDACCFPA